MSVITLKLGPFFKGILLCILLVNALGLPQIILIAHAEVGTDQKDYVPGSVVTVRGKNDVNGAPGYVAQKAVNVAVLGPNGWTVKCSTSVRADRSWSCAITLDPNPAIAVGDYTYTATSTDVNGSLISETGTFSDGSDSIHTCIVTKTMGVKCWGNNFYGQLGDGSTTQRTTPVDVIGLTNGVTQVSAGGGYTCALTASGGIKCWGDNQFGQLGDGTTTQRTTPVDVIGLTSGVTQVSAGFAHTCALTNSGTIKCWGYNAHGQLGDGSIGENRLTPVDVIGLTNGVIQVSAGGGHTCALTTSGGVKCWGNNAAGQLGADVNTMPQTTPVDVQGLTNSVTQVSAGDAFSCALTTSGGVKCWGGNSDGQLGDGTFGDSRPTPVNVIGLTSGVIQVSAGAQHSCALVMSGTVKCWGRNDTGQLGDGTIILRTTPVDVIGLTSSMTQVSASGFHTCALAASGGIECWGDNQYGQLGDGTGGVSRPTPVDVFGLSSGVTQVSAGTEHTCSLTSGGVKCWGRNNAGQLGDGTTIQRNTPLDVIGLANGMTHVSAGGLHTCVLMTNGGVKCWGNNGYGQLGDGTTVQRSTSVDVLGLSSGVTQVSAGGYAFGYTCALMTGGDVKCWGSNFIGQLGDGTITDRTTPVDVLGLTSGATQVSTGSYHTCVVTTTGGVKCWGYNISGQLGDGTNTRRTMSVDVLGLTSGVAQVSAGDSHTCALTTSGGVKCWGDNSGGQLGDGTTIQRTTPVDVLGLSSRVTQISVGDIHTCALMTGGGIKCWGYNFNAQLGDGTHEQYRLTPVDVLGLTSGATQVSAGGGHTCALTTSGGAKCWGFNGVGVLGNGGPYRNEPVYVLVSEGGAPLSDVAKLSEGVASATPEHITITPLDSFNRADGRLKSPWYGPEGLGGYSIRAQQVAVLGGGPLYWNDKAFGPAQQAGVTLTQLDVQHREHGLMLKAQGNPPNWRKGYIHVYYFADNQTVQVSAYQPARGVWTDYAPLAMRYVNGDQLGAQAWPDGRVRIFRNGFLVGVVQLNATDQAFYSTRGGRIGLWFNGYGASINATLDDFGGGDISVPVATLSASNLASAESSISANDGNVPVVTAYTERHYPRGDMLFEQQFLPVLMANSK